MTYKWVDFDAWVAHNNITKGVLISHIKVDGEWVKVIDEVTIVKSNNNDNK